MIDAFLIFSEKQKITSSAVSTNHVDFDVVFNPGTPPPQVVVTVDETFAALTSLEIKVCESANGTDSSATELASSGKIPVAKLTSGMLIPINVPIPFRNVTSGKPCLFLKYVVEGTPATKGSVTAAVEEYPFTNMPSNALAKG